MENLTLLIIYRTTGTFKWQVEDGIVTRRFTSSAQEEVENPCEVEEFLSHNRKVNIENMGFDTFICAYLETRFADETNPRGFGWTVNKKFER